MIANQRIRPALGLALKVQIVTAELVLIWRAVRRFVLRDEQPYRIVAGRAEDTGVDRRVSDLEPLAKLLT
jgi:hypothetical protein